MTVDASGNLNAATTLMNLYTQLTPAAQAQALTLFTAYQATGRVSLTGCTVLLQEVIALVKAESPTLGALAEWGAQLYTEQQEFGYGAAYNPFASRLTTTDARWRIAQ